MDVLLPFRGSFQHLIATSGGAQQDRFAGGSQLIAQRLAGQLGDGVVRLRQPVLRISAAADRVTCVTPAAEFTSRRVIVSVPPALAGRIDYEPALPAGRDQLTQRAPMGSVIKCQAVYDEPFWRAAGLSGQATGDGAGSRVVFDNSPPDGSPGILLAFVEGDEARLLGRASARVRRRAVLDSLARYFGPRAASPADYLELDWQQERWTGGCYGTLFGPNVWTRYGYALSKPVGLIHWAGTETATRWCAAREAIDRWSSALSVAAEAAPSAFIDGVAGQGMSLTLLAILGDIDDPRATTILCEHIKDEEWLSRWNAVGSLGRRNDATSRQCIERALDDPHLVVRSAAIKGISRWDGRSSHLALRGAA